MTDWNVNKVCLNFSTSSIFQQWILMSSCPFKKFINDSVLKPAHSFEVSAMWASNVNNRQNIFFDVFVCCVFLYLSFSFHWLVYWSPLQFGSCCLTAIGYSNWFWAHRNMLKYQRKTAVAIPSSINSQKYS